MESILTWARDVLTTTAIRWASLTGTLSLDLLSRSPAPKEWSELECLQHLVDTERWVFPVRLRAFLAGQDFPAFDPDTQGSKRNTQGAPVELAELFSQLRKTSLVELAAITAADLERSARHAELGIVTLGEMVHEWAGHDLMHTVQAERALMQPFIQGCGPWQPYFVDHVARVGPS
jgi:hypothetical protein